MSHRIPGLHRVFARIAIVFLLLALAAPLAAQDAADLTVDEEISLIEGEDAFGLRQIAAEGRLINEGADAYANIALTAFAYNADGAQIGEGYGVLVNACGAGLAFDFALQPGASQRFSIPLELFELDSEIARVEVSATGEAVAPAPPRPPLAEGIVSISDQEVVAVEWEDQNRFRYAIGCERDLFIDWVWRRHDLTTGDDQFIEHPYSERVTDDLRAALRLEDPLIFANSRLRFAPTTGARLVFQDRINDIYTAAADGRFQRRLYTLLNSYSLQGYIWLPGDRFLAYYYGALGDEVIYFAADVEGRFIGPGPLRNRPSVITPGISPDGRRVILAGTFDGVTGYYIDVLTQNFFELLFEAEPPGNNYPPPIALVNEDGTRVTQVYVIRPVDDVPLLQCFSRPEEGDNELLNLAVVPLDLGFDERAWTFLSPDERYIALSANGINAGLWLLDLETLPPCGPQS